MLHKLGYEFYCECCDKPVHEDDVGCGDNNYCSDCQSDYEEKMRKHFKPLYDGEKMAGLLPSNHYKGDKS